MGYWPKSVKRRRHNWVTDLGRKLVLLGCEGSHSPVMVFHGPRHRAKGIKVKYFLCHPDLHGVPDGAYIGPGQQVSGWSMDSATIKGARMMEIIKG